MCGIAGFIQKSFPDTAEHLIQKMTNTLKHRGPDALGVYVDPESNTAFGHVRLSIIDLSQSANQPMCLDDSFVTIFNGEIYNYRELKHELESKGHIFTTTSDTEVLLKSYIAWGTDCFKKMEGMWAVALLDKKAKKIILCRDRCGEKPLYFYRDAGIVVFGSELKALVKHPAVKRTVDLQALALFFELQYIPHPFCIYKNVEQLSPATFVEISFEATIVQRNCYWQPPAQCRGNKSIDVNEYVANYKKKLDDLIIKRMIADVPLGVFLSGGIDSTLLTTAACTQLQTKVKTFTIGYEDRYYDESGYARKIADYLHTDHHEFILSQKEFAEALAQYIPCFDEPFADESAIAVMLLSHYTKKHVKVALGGDGGDELFGGYERYNHMQQYNQLFQIPRVARQGLSMLCTVLKNTRLSPAAAIMQQPNAQALYHYILSVYKPDDMKKLISTTNEQKNFLRQEFIGKDHISEQLFEIDFRTYLPDLVLAKVDRASMSSALEVRAPFLDSDLIAWSRTIPIQYKIGKNAKLLSKKCLAAYGVPNHLFERRKQGFGAPLEKWLLQGNQEFIVKLFDIQNLDKFEYINRDFAKEVYTRFKNGDKRYKMRFWVLCSFLMWADHWLFSKGDSTNG